MRIIVTGATGFIGSHLVEALCQKDSVLAVDIKKPLSSYFSFHQLEKKAEFIKADIANFHKIKGIIDSYRPDYIFHLGAVSLVDNAFENPLLTFRTNITGTINILESARQLTKIKGVIVASSDKAYGKMESRTQIDTQDNIYSKTKPKGTILKTELNAMTFENPKSRYFAHKIGNQNKLGVLEKFVPEDLSNTAYCESDPLAGNHPYEVSKSCADLISQSYFKTYGLPVVIARCGNVYGEGDMNFSRLIPGMLKAVIKKSKFEIRSNGKFIRNYIYIEDVISAYLQLANNVNKIKGEAFNFGSKDTYSVLQLIKETEKKLGVKLKYKILNEAKNEIPYQVLDYKKAEKMLGWKPEYRFGETIEKVFLWYQKYI